jgi:phosphotransferase family enzyme
MRIDDELLPAAPYLTGPHAADVVGAGVAAAGGRLHSARPVHVQYRPGSDIVVRYSAEVTWGNGESTHDTLVVGASTAGTYPGTLPLAASSEAGEVAVSMWRWPFDPFLTGLDHAVTPRLAARLLEGVLAGPVELEVVAYRPCERAVVRATGAAGAAAYLKVVPPAQFGALVDRHRGLLAAGLPVARPLVVDAELGVMAMEELSGDTLRLRLKAGTGPWPDGAEFVELGRRLAATPAGPGWAPVSSRVRDAIAHGSMLATVVPELGDRVGRLNDLFSGAVAAVEARSGVTIHGDLYEAQVIVGGERGERIVGLLDIDGVGPGDPLDDRATLLAHLSYRARTATTGGEQIAGYVRALRGTFLEIIDAAELDTVAAAVTVGLATAPFRLQQRGWAAEVRRHLAAAEALLDAL